MELEPERLLSVVQFLQKNSPASFNETDNVNCQIIVDDIDKKTYDGVLKLNNKIDSRMERSQ